MLKIDWLAKNIGTIADLLTPQECDAYIAFSEAQRYEEATVTTERGMVMMKDLRNNDRVMLDDEARAQELYDRIADLVPARFEEDEATWRPVGLNERLRFYRYDVGQLFNWHLDGYFERANGERSFFTFMVYLNDDFTGGGTSFRNGYDFGTLVVRPRKGMGLIFHHPIRHRGDTVTEGRKYVIRSDVMYARDMP